MKQGFLTSAKPSKERIFDLIRIGLYTLFFVAVTMHLNEYDNAKYQVLKDRQFLYGMAFFLLIIWTVQKVRLLNWQSALVTLLMGGVTFLRAKGLVSSPDIFTNTIIDNVIKWMALMPLVDMCVKKKSRKWDTVCIGRFILLCLVTTLFVIFGFGRSATLAYILFVILCVIPFENKEWDKLIKGFINGCFVTFIVVAIISLSVNPVWGVSEAEFMERNREQYGRWFGYFLNIGNFGQFLGLNFAVVLASMHYYKTKIGRLSLRYFISVLWLAAVIYFAVLNGTSNFVVGAVVTLLVLFVFARSRATKKWMITKGVIILAIFVIVLVGLILLSNYVYSPNFSEDKLNAVCDNIPVIRGVSAVRYLNRKLAMANELADIAESAFPPRSFARFLDYLSSNRLGISYEFLKLSTFRGTAGGGLLYYIGDYWAENAHNQYVQVLYEYGFLAGGLQIILALTLWISSICRYVKTRRNRYFLSMTLMSLMLGMWMGEASSVCYPLTFFGIMFALVVLFVDEDKKTTAFIKNLIEDKEHHIFCIGSKSIGMYGGYESFIKGLIEQDGDSENQYYVSCKANGEGHMDVRALPDAIKIDESRFVYNGAIGYLVYVNTNLGPGQAIQYDVEALKSAIDYIVKYHIEDPKVYIMACRIGPFIGKYIRKIHRLGGEVYINPDGHEWMRTKWSKPIRAYWKKSEKLMVKKADLVVCDSVNIEKYIKEEYAKFEPKTTFIAYGVEEIKSTLADDAQEFTGWLAEHGLEKDKYYLGVGRFVPENNFETMIREFMKSKTDKKMVFVTTPNPKLYEKLDSELHFTDDARIVFPGSVYDRELLKKIRENAYAYLHGHEVGGTNPSLLESLAGTKLNLLYEVGFNKEVAKDAALYWNKDEGNLSSLIDKADGLSAEEISQFEDKAKKRIEDAYSWPIIVKKYRKIWKQ